MIDVYYTYNRDTLEVNQTGISTTRFSLIPECPLDALLVKPLPEKEGFIVRVCDFENGRPTSTEYVADHRGKTIYNKVNCNESKTVTELGEVEEGWTLVAPQTQFDEWIDGEWIVNLQNQYEAQVVVVRDTREALYKEQVDRLRNEATSIRRIEGDDAKAEIYDKQADAAYLKIREENPWPVRPEVA